MRRAVVLIGVSRTGGLPELQAVHAGVQKMHDWALAQGIPEEAIKTLSDEKKGSEVRIHQIVDVIQELLEPGTLEQLFVYFSGHGVYNGGDFWLLSRAPGYASEAVNVEDSMQLARCCGLDHVVLISDCCRTAPQGVQAQSIKGGGIFPNDPVDGMERTFVDGFFACARGKPSLEVRDPNLSAQSYRAIYTDAISSALCGMELEALTAGTEKGQAIALVHPWRLQDFLQEKVPKRIQALLSKQPTVNQTPVARIGSRDRWLSKISPAPAGLRAPLVETDRGDAAGPDAAGTIGTNSARLVWTLASDAGSMLSQTFARAPVFGSITGSQEFVYRRDAAAWSFGPKSFETRCGFKLSGQRVRAVYGSDSAEILANGELVRLSGVDETTRREVVLLELDDGAGVCMPAIPEFIGELRFDEDGELTHVAYEPSEFTERWAAWEPRALELRNLRATVSASVNRGVFRLREGTVSEFVEGIRTPRSVDPALALYGAYALHDLGRREEIRAMLDSLRADLGIALFDLALLAADQRVTQCRQDGVLAPPFPLLTNGWTLLSAFKTELDPDFMDLRSHLRQSVWTVFEPAGTEKLIKRIETNGVL